MRFQNNALLQLGVLIMLVLLAPRLSEADALTDAVNEQAKPETLSVESGFDLATGKYGSSSSTNTVSVPLSIVYFPTDRLDVGLSVPYLWQNTQLVVAGKVVRFTGVRAAQRRAEREKPVNGVGDLLLAAGYTLVAESDRLPQLRPVLSVKIPTADTSLGTGEFDETCGLGLSKSLGEWFLFLDGGYTLQGKSDLFVAKNFVDFDLGIGYQILAGLRPSLAVKGASAAQAGVDGNLQIEGKLVYTATRAVDLKLYLDRGLSVSSPDWEGGCSLSYNF